MQLLVGSGLEARLADNPAANHIARYLSYLIITCTLVTYIHTLIHCTAEKTKDHFFQKLPLSVALIYLHLSLSCVYRQSIFKIFSKSTNHPLSQQNNGPLNSRDSSHVQRNPRQVFLLRRLSPRLSQNQARKTHPDKTQVADALLVLKCPSAGSLADISKPSPP